MDKLYGQLSPLMPLTGEASKRSGKGETGFYIKTAGEALAAAGDFDLDTALAAVNKLLASDFGGQLNKLAEKAAGALNDFDFDAAAEYLNSAIKAAGYK
jgi:hypothetical protein